MTGQRKKPAGDEISAGGLAVGLVVLVPGALLMALVPFMSAINRMGFVGTTLLLLGIVVLSIAFFRAYEYLKPSFPPTPRRDFVIIVFAALVIGLWIFAFTNAVVAVLALAGLGVILLLPDDWNRWLANRLPWKS